MQCRTASLRVKRKTARIDRVIHGELPMRLDPITPERLIRAARRFERIEQQFAEFSRALDWFKSPECPLRQVTVEQGEDLRCVIASFGTTKVALRLHLILGEDGVAAGQVVCTRSQPKLGATDPLIMSFTFDAQGRTSFDMSPDGDPVELGQNAVEIVMHALEAAARAVNG